MLYIKIVILLLLSIDNDKFKIELLRFNKYANYDPNFINMIISYSDFINDIIIYFKNPNATNQKIKDFLKEYDESFIDEYLKNNTNNLIKTVVFKDIYVNQDKENVFNVINTIDEDGLEFKYITIILPLENYVNKSIIDNVFGEFSDGIYELMTQEILPGLSSNDKLKLLFKQKLIIPIVDDFLRYNRMQTDNSFFFEYENRETVTKQDSKLKFLISQLNKIIELYNYSNTDQIELNKNFTNTLSNRKAIIINDLEELYMMDKIIKTGQTNTEIFNDISHYRRYPFINFKYNSDHSFMIKLDDSINMFRYINFSKNPTKYVQTRISNDMINIVGIIIPPLQNKDITCLKNNKIKKLSSNNNYDATIKIIDNYMKNKDYHSWLFNEKTDIIKLTQYVDMTNFEYFNQAIVSLYDQFIIIFGEHFESLIKKSKYININKVNYYLELFQDRFLPLQDIDYFKKLIFYKSYNEIHKTIPQYTNSLKLFNYNKKIKYDSNHIISYIKDTIIFIEDIYSNSTCQHLLSYDELRRQSREDFHQNFYNFFNKYVFINKQGNYTCKSCGGTLEFPHFVIDFDSQYGAENLTLALTVPLEDIKSYEKQLDNIKIMHKIIEQIASISNLYDYTGKQSINKVQRQMIIKNVIDIEKILYRYYKKDIKRFIETFFDAKYGISSQFSNFFIFQFNIDLFKNKNNDELSTIKYNNVISHIICNIIILITEKNIKLLSIDKVCNLYLFNKFGNSLFKDINIIINDFNKTININNYQILCYLMYYFSCMLIRYNIWQFQKTHKFDISVQKTIINTLCHTLNSILYTYNNNKNNYTFQHISTRFFINLKTIYNDKKIIDYLNSKIKNKIEVKDNKLVFNETQIIPTLIPLKGYKLRIINNFNYIKKFYLTEKLKKFHFDFELEKYKDNYLKELKDFYKDLKLRYIAKQLLNEKFIKNNNSLLKKYEKITDYSNNISKNLENDFSKINLNKYIKDTLTEFSKYVTENFSIYNYFAEKKANINIFRDTYIIDHDMYGNKLDKPQIINIQSHEGNNKELYYYDNTTKTEVLYDFNSLNLIGYRTKDKNTKIVSEKFLIKRNSIMSMLFQIDIKNLINFTRKIFNQIYNNYKSFDGISSFVVQKYENKLEKAKLLNNIMLQVFDNYIDNEILLYYYLKEINILLENNNDKYHKITLIYLIIDIITFYFYSIDPEINNKEINSFKFIIIGENVTNNTIEDEDITVDFNDLSEDEQNQIEDEKVEDEGDTEGIDMERDEDFNEDVDSEDEFHTDAQD